MKKKIVVSTPVLALLIAALLVSLVANFIQLGQADSPVLPSITGSYSTNTFSSDSTYLVFEKDNSFTLYNQREGVLEQGKYTESINHQYSLEGNSGTAGTVILTEDGLYYIPDDASVTFFQRFSDTPTYAGSWTTETDKES